MVFSAAGASGLMNYRQRERARDHFEQSPRFVCLRLRLGPPDLNE
jgi:hypothetical protein